MSIIDGHWVRDTSAANAAAVATPLTHQKITQKRKAESKKKESAAKNPARVNAPDFLGLTKP